MQFTVVCIIIDYTAKKHLFYDWKGVKYNLKEILKVFPRRNELPMYSTLAGTSYCDGSYRIHRTCADDTTVIEYVLAGEGWIRLNGKDCPVTADQIYILPKGMEQYYYSDGEKPWRKIFINLGGDLPVALLREYGLTGGYVFDGAGLKPLFLRVQELVASDQPDGECQAELSAIFLEVLTRLCSSQKKAGHSDEAVALKEYLDANMNRIVSNAELAGSIFRSPDYCVKLFGREYGVTPYEYQLREKMNMACHLLSGTHLAVSEVAEAIGYHDARYFSGLFRRRCGLSPRAFRNSQKQNNRP